MDRLQMQTQNLIDQHNTHTESERIWKEYTEQLLNLTDNQYNSDEYPSIQLQYSILDLDYYRPQPRRSNIHTNSQDPVGYYPPPQTQQMFNAGTHMVEENAHICTHIDSLEKWPNQQKVERQEKDARTSNSILES